MKNILSLCVCAVLAFALPASAQLGTNTSVSLGAVGGVQSTFLVGGTNALVNGATNYVSVGCTNIIVPCATHPNVGFTLGYQCMAGATNGNIIVGILRSYDNANSYETTNLVKQFFTNALPTAVDFVTSARTNWTALFDIPGLTNATHFQVSSITNTGGGIITNLSMTFNLNNPTTWVVPAPR